MATAQTFTPGPWSVCDEPKNASWVHGRTIYSEYEQSRVADVSILRNDAQAFADARLIAAAPALLAALEEAHEILRWVEDAPGAVVAQVRSAIALIVALLFSESVGDAIANAWRSLWVDRSAEFAAADRMQARLNSAAQDLMFAEAQAKREREQYPNGQRVKSVHLSSAGK